MDSKRALPPKFNASVNPFSKIKTGTKSQSKTDLMEQKKIAYRIRRRRRINKMDKFETAINAAMLNSMASKDATMTLECIESREGGVEQSKFTVNDTSERGSHSNINNSPPRQIEGAESPSQRLETMEGQLTKQSMTPTPASLKQNPLKTVHDINM